MHEEVSVEVQHACRLSTSIRAVFELRGTKRFVPGDPLVDFLACMRSGTPFPDGIWTAFEATFATDGTHGIIEPRHSEPRFCNGYGMAMYWETLARWIPRRALRDARALKVPLIFCQSYDQCGTMDRETSARFLNVVNIHKTGNMHGIFTVHVGMRVRLTQKINATHGLVTEQRATVVDVVMHANDKLRYSHARPGSIFRTEFLPAGFWLQVDDFDACPVWEDLLPFVADEESTAAADESRAKGMFFLPAMEADCVFQSTEKHIVKRSGFSLTHAFYLTATAAQGQTIGTGVIIDCARMPPQGRVGMHNETWWLNLYVMFSRATKMSDMLLIRPPPRSLLEAGPPANVRAQLQKFNERVRDTRKQAEERAAKFDSMCLRCSGENRCPQTS